MVYHRAKTFSRLLRVSTEHAADGDHRRAWVRRGVAPVVMNERFGRSQTIPQRRHRRGHRGCQPRRPVFLASTTRALSRPHRRPRSRFTAFTRSWTARRTTWTSTAKESLNFAELKERMRPLSFPKHFDDIKRMRRYWAAIVIGQASRLRPRCSRRMALRSSWQLQSGDHGPTLPTAPSLSAGVETKKTARAALRRWAGRSERRRRAGGELDNRNDRLRPGAIERGPQTLNEAMA